MPSRVRRSRKSNSGFAAVAACLALAFAVAPARANDEPFKKPRALKVCDDPNNLPFSNDKGEGFENRIAEILAKKLGLSLEVFHYPQRINIVRNTIRYKLPNESEYRCDLLVGVPSDFTAVATTKPYMHSTYVLVYAKGGKIDAASEAQFLAMDKATLGKLRIGVYERTPAVEWMKKHGLLDQAVPHRLMNADPANYPGLIIEDDLARGKIDAAIVWGPIGGFFAQRAKSPEMVVLPLKSEPGARLDFAVSMGVRQGEKAWREMVQHALDESRDEIAEVLRQYNVPIVDEKGAASR